MFPDINFVDYVIMLIGGLLCFKKVAEMERYYNLRMIMLSSILGAILILFFATFVSAFDDHFEYDYYYPESSDHFTVSEMVKNFSID